VLNDKTLYVNGRNRYISQFLQDDLIVDFSNNNDELFKLSLSERKIVTLIAQQKTSKQIAELLFISKKQSKDTDEIL